MRRARFLKFFVVFVIFLFSTVIFAQPANSPQPKNPADSDESTPPILKHLPDWENVQNRAAYISNSDDLQKVLGNRPVFNFVNFVGGTEAATADYDAGKLLIVEYGTPQFSIDADNRISQFLAGNQQNPPVVFRRVGNYEVFVFDGNDETAANALIDQVKYEKNVQWLGQDPFLLQRAERAYLEKTSNVFVSTIISIVLGLTLAAFLGIAAGLIVFYARKQKRASMTAFTDAGGMTRLNLDDLTPDVLPDRLLKG
ncbi:MAG: hypothetical protein ACR2N3_18095 [Pyrinomonadaceae bacterium]